MVYLCYAQNENGAYRHILADLTTATWLSFFIFETAVAADRYGLQDEVLRNAPQAQGEEKSNGPDGWAKLQTTDGLSFFCFCEEKGGKQGSRKGASKKRKPWWLTRNKPYITLDVQRCQRRIWWIWGTLNYLKHLQTVWFGKDLTQLPCRNEHPWKFPFLKPCCSITWFRDGGQSFWWSLLFGLFFVDCEVYGDLESSEASDFHGFSHHRTGNAGSQESAALVDQSHSSKMFSSDAPHLNELPLNPWQARNQPSPFEREMKKSSRLA